MSDASIWQLQMFKRTLKKRMRLRHLSRTLGEVASSERCLLVTCGDNNGAINYYLAQGGGQWHWADLEDTSIEEMAELLGTEVLRATESRIPFADGFFQRVISIDVHEHVVEPQDVTREMARVSAPGAQVLITVPGGDPKQLVNRLKNRIGMTKDKYGHVRDGFSSDEIMQVMRASGISPVKATTFSRFFTELVELGINYLYVNVLSRRGDKEVKSGTIAPQTHEQIRSVGRSYRIYSAVYPFVWLFSKLDGLLFFTKGYVVVVEGRKPQD